MSNLLVTGSAPGAAAGPPRRALVVWLAVVRVLAVLHAALAVAQPVFIGQYLTGLATWLGFHAAGATALVLLGLLLVPATTGYAISGGRRWLPVAYLVLLVTEILQTGMGYARILAVHIPLGVFVVTAAVLLAAAVLRPSLAVGRARRASTGTSGRGRR